MSMKLTSLILLTAGIPMALSASDCSSGTTLTPEDQLACDTVWTGDALKLGVNTSEATSALLITGIDQAYLLTVPSSGVGYATFEVPDWHIELALYHAPDVKVTVTGGEAVETLSTVSGCAEEPNLLKEVTLFHEWGAYPVTVSGPAGSQVWFMAFDPTQVAP